LLQIKLKHRDYEKLREGATWLYNVLKQHVAVPILGPEEPAINRIRNEYIRIILIKIPNNANLIGTKNIIKKALVSFEATSQYRAIKTTINVDY
jgi:primosomal protein N' (replication factor Y)